MNIKDQVISRHQAAQIKKLGIVLPSLFHWYEDEDVISGEHWAVGQLFNPSDENLPAYTVAELGEMLPMYCDTTNCHTGWDCTYKTRPKGLIHMEGCHKTEAQARASMLIHLLENNLLTP